MGPTLTVTSLTGVDGGAVLVGSKVELGMQEAAELLTLFIDKLLLSLTLEDVEPGWTVTSMTVFDRSAILVGTVVELGMQATDEFLTLLVDKVSLLLTLDNMGPGLILTSLTEVDKSLTLVGTIVDLSMQVTAEFSELFTDMGLVLTATPSTEANRLEVLTCIWLKLGKQGTTECSTSSKDEISLSLTLDRLGRLKVVFTCSLAFFPIFSSFLSSVVFFTRNAGFAVDWSLKMLRFSLIIRAGRSLVLTWELFNDLRKLLRLTARLPLAFETEGSSEATVEATVKSGFVLPMLFVRIRRLFMLKSTTILPPC